MSPGTSAGSGTSPLLPLSQPSITPGGKPWLHTVAAGNFTISRHWQAPCTLAGSGTSPQHNLSQPSITAGSMPWLHTVAASTLSPQQAVALHIAKAPAQPQPAQHHRGWQALEVGRKGKRKKGEWETIKGSLKRGIVEVRV